MACNRTKATKSSWVVREVLSGDILLARSLLASGRDDLSALWRAAVAGLEDLPVVGIISDGQQALRQAVAVLLLPLSRISSASFIICEKPVGRFGKRIATRRRNCASGCAGYATIERAVEDRTDPPAEVIRGYCAAVRGALADSGQPPLEAGDSNLSILLACPPLPPASTGWPKRGGPAPLTRLHQALRRALDATAPLWPEVVIGQGWLAEAAQILANPDGADRATVEARYAVLSAHLQEEAAPSASLQAMAAQFVKVTAKSTLADLHLLRRGRLTPHQ